MTIRARAYANRKATTEADVRVSLSMDMAEAKKLAKAKGEGVVGDLAAALREATSKASVDEALKAKANRKPRDEKKPRKGKKSAETEDE